MNLKETVLSGIAILALLLGVLTYTKTIKVDLPPAGAIPGSSVDGNEWCVGGVCTYSYTQNITATSSNLCTIAAPTATSTLISFSVYATSTFGAAQTFDISTSSNTAKYGTSSPSFVRAASLGANSKLDLVWRGPGTTTNSIAGGGLLIGTNPSTGASDIVIRSGEYVTARIATATPGTFGSYVTGSCRATFLKLGN